MLRFIGNLFCLQAKKKHIFLNLANKECVQKNSDHGQDIFE